MKNTQTEKYFLIALITLVFGFSFAIFYPFINMIILAGSFSIVLYPLYKWIKTKITREKSGLASIVTTIIFVLVLCVPVFIISNLVFKQIEHLVYLINTNNNTNFIFERINNYTNNTLPSGFHFDIQNKITSMVDKFSSNIASFFASIVRSVAMFFLMIVSIFYILKNSVMWKKNLIDISPLKKENTEEVLSKLQASVNQILKGTLFIAIIQGLLTSLGFMIFGIPNPALWGIVAAIASFIPSIGTAIVSVPAVVYLFFNGSNIPALGLLAWSFLLIGMIDNILSPYLISKDTEISSLFTLFSILGGLTLLGPIGILIGPLTLSLLYSLVSVYKKQD